MQAAIWSETGDIAADLRAIKRPPGSFSAQAGLPAPQGSVVDTLEEAMIVLHRAILLANGLRAVEPGPVRPFPTCGDRWAATFG